jgi:4-amino-4-deoxy-L-arabinose transferase-like glycosyltransferase
MNKRREALLVLGLFLLAMAVAAAFWAVLPAEYRQNQSTDYAFQYEPVARAILAGRGITDAEGELATRYPPGFSVLLAGTWGLGGAVGASEAASLLAFRLLCAGLSAVLLYGLARLVWRAEAALLVGLAWASYPFFLWITKQPNSEVPFIPVFFGALLVFWLAVLRRPRAWALYFLAGALAGVAMLIRPAALGLGVVMAVLILCLARPVRLPARFGLAALLLLGNLLAVAPWTAAAYAETGLIIPLSTGGEVSFKDGLTFLVAYKDYRREVPVAEDVAAMMRTFQTRRTEMKSSGDVLVVVLDEARKAPVTFLKFTLLKAGRSWYGIDSRTFEGPTLALQAVYFALILWGNAYIFFGRRPLPGAHGNTPGGARRMLAGNWLIVLYFWAMTMTVVPLLRYMLPVMGPLFIALPGVYYSLQPRLVRRSSFATSNQ